MRQEQREKEFGGSILEKRTSRLAVPAFSRDPE
jgi:hypothetical protein